MKKIVYFSFLLLLFISCATKKLQIDNDQTSKVNIKEEPTHSFYLIGDSGENDQVLKELRQQLSLANQNTSVLFLGNNSFNNNYDLKRKEIYRNQLNILNSFQGNAFFIPGSYEWEKGLKNLKKHEKEIVKKLGKHSFQPKNGCPISQIKIDNNTTIIAVDSEWYFENWDHHQTINDDCEIKNRFDFFEEFESLIKKNVGKTTIIAIHRPMFSNGIYGGASTFTQQLYPLPILGHAIRKTGGTHKSDLQNKRYIEFSHQIIRIAQYNPKVILTSAHEQSLQYLEEDNLVQIISGSGGIKASATKNKNALFTYGANGYAKLNIYADGSSFVDFFALENDTIKKVFSRKIYDEDEIHGHKNYPKNFPKEVSAQIYTDEEVTSTKAQRFFWGDRYRKYYGTSVTVPTVNLDTLHGGMIPIRMGGGHQSKSLRLECANGKEYVMRALRKSGTKYLQAVVFKDHHVENQYEKSGLEKLVMDVFTGSHPYAPFVIGTLSNAIGVYHTNPELYYVPKQNSLGEFNHEFGNELYMIEERAASNHEELDSFGNAKKVISTGDMYNNLRENSNYYIDQDAYIKARLFDMLIGDWDRHGDQWRWAEFTDEKGIKFYRPIPRDRDQAFSIMDDGFLLGTATKLIPASRILRSYDKDLKSPKWMNAEPFPLDVTLTSKSNEDVWIKQAKYIQEHLTNESIDRAFSLFPDEVTDETIDDLKEKLKSRRKNLDEIAKKYYKHLSKYPIITGTDKDNIFEIERLSKGRTTIRVYHSKKNKKELLFEKTYSKKKNREIWIFGLDEDDTFHVYGKGNKYIPIRIMGGQGKDTYNIEKGNKVAMYDFKSKKNVFKTNKGTLKLKDSYTTNIFNYSKIENNTNALAPTIGFNPDDGIKIGLSETYTINGFERNPFSQKHHISGAYFFATNGYEIAYNGELAHVIGKLNLGLETSFQSPNYSMNFFGFGNGSENLEPDNDAIDLDYNRVKIEQFKLKPSLIYKGKLESQLKLSAIYEVNKPEETPGRFIANTDEIPENTFSSLNFLGTEFGYHYENKNHKDFTTLGLKTSLITGYKANINESKSYGYIIPTLSINYKLDFEGNIVLATKLKSHINIGDGYEFYQAASIGGVDGLRGFRNQRFTGQESFYQNTDLRFIVKEFQTHVIPIKLGMYGGFDYGRVWSDVDLSGAWNTSYGGGIWLDGASLFTAQFGAFNSVDGFRFTFGLGFGF